MSKNQVKSAIIKLVNTWSSDYQRKANSVVDEILRLIDKGVPASEAIDKTLKKSGFFDDIFGKNLNNALFYAAAQGYGIIPSVVTEPVKANIINKLTASWTASDMKLSEKIHGVKAEMRAKIVDTIQTTIKAGTNWKELSRKLYDGYNHGKVIDPGELPKYLNELKTAAHRTYLSADDAAAAKEYKTALDTAKRNIKRLSEAGNTNSLKAAYEQLVRAAEKGSLKALEKSAWVAVQETSRYNAERIARTELSRAWGDGFFAATYEDEAVIAYKWSLSSAHKNFDICDFNAAANLYGFGPGIYPKNAMPAYPAHPHCTCQLSEVIEGSNKNTRKDNVANGGKKYLNSLTETQRDGLLTYDGNQAFKKGGDWQDHLNNWQGHEDPNPRLTKGDFEK